MGGEGRADGVDPGHRGARPCEEGGDAGDRRTGAEEQEREGEAAFGARREGEAQQPSQARARAVEQDAARGAGGRGEVERREREDFHAREGQEHHDVFDDGRRPGVVMERQGDDDREPDEPQRGGGEPQRADAVGGGRGDEGDGEAAEEEVRGDEEPRHGQNPIPFVPVQLLVAGRGEDGEGDAGDGAEGPDAPAEGGGEAERAEEEREVDGGRGADGDGEGPGEDEEHVDPAEQVGAEQERQRAGEEEREHREAGADLAVDESGGAQGGGGEQLRAAGAVLGDEAREDVAGDDEGEDRPEEGGEPGEDHLAAVVVERAVRIRLRDDDEGRGEQLDEEEPDDRAGDRARTGELAQLLERDGVHGVSGRRAGAFERIIAQGRTKGKAGCLAEAFLREWRTSP